jgi:hypothetical protein
VDRQRARERKELAANAEAVKILTRLLDHLIGPLEE